MLKFEFWNIFWTVFNVLLLYVLLRIFLFKPINKMLDDRTQAVPIILKKSKKFFFLILINI